MFTKKCSPNTFSPKKIFTQNFFRTSKFFTESVRLSFVDLRWAQLYVSLVIVYLVFLVLHLLSNPEYRRRKKSCKSCPNLGGRGNSGSAQNNSFFLRRTSLEPKLCIREGVNGKKRFLSVIAWITLTKGIDSLKENGLWGRCKKK